MDDNPKWFALYTRPRFEKKACQSLIDLGFEAYLPLYKTIRKWSDRKMKVEIPLISSYCFVRIRPTEYYKPLQAYGVVKHIKFEDKAVPIRDQDIEIMKAICSGDYEPEIVDLNYAPGSPLIIKSGPLKGIEGEFIKVAGRNKMLIRIESINHGILVNVHQGNVELLPASN